MKRLLLAGVASVAVSTGLVAQNPSTTQAPATPPVVTVTMVGTVTSQYKYTKDMWIKTAAAMPAEDYSFKPMPEMRTFAAGMGHILASNIGQCGTLVGHKHATLAGVDLEKTLTTKDETVKDVADTFAFCDEYFLKLTDETNLTDTFNTLNGRRSGQPTVFKFSTASSILSFIAHNNEMYGYQAVYLRLKGITPPSSVPAGKGLSE